MNVVERNLNTISQGGLWDLGLSAISGGHILSGFVVALILASFPNLSKRIFGSDVIAKAVLIGVLGGAIFLVEQRILPLAVSLIAATAVAALSFRTAALWMAARINVIAWPSSWPSIRLSTAVFSMGILIYLFTLGAPYVWVYLDSNWIAREEENTKLALFTLPVSHEVVGHERNSKTEELEWKIFDSTQKTFAEAFSQLEDDVRILPVVKEGKDGFGRLRERFAEREYDDELLLDTYREYGLPRGADHVYVLRMLYDAGQDGIDYTFQLLRLDNPPAVNGRIRLSSILDRQVRLLAKRDEMRRVALLAGTVVARALVKKTGIEEEDAEGIWTRLDDRFRSYFKNDDRSKDLRPEDWVGPDAFNKACSPMVSCLELWMVAYSEPAEGRSNRSIAQTAVIEIPALDLMVEAATRSRTEDL